jgi:tetratricopeptide (TPR) repeat protein
MALVKIIYTRLSISLVLLFTITFMCGAEAVPEAAFDRAVKLMEAGRYAEAIPLLKEAQEAYPSNPNVLWNLGIASAEIGDHPLALATWKLYRNAKPDDWRARAKLIQSYQALGRTAERDQERAALIEFRKALPAKLAESMPSYCREQFNAGNRKVLAFELFEPKSPKRIYLRFSVLDESGKEEYFISLGSYDSTTDIARELGEIAKDARAFHLDRYDRVGHATFAHFNNFPSYESVRAMVVDILDGKRRPLSSTSKSRESPP